MDGVRKTCDFRSLELRDSQVKCMDIAVEGFSEWHKWWYECKRYD